MKMCKELGGWIKKDCEAGKYPFILSTELK